MQIQIPGTIRKDQITPFGAMAGHANSTKVLIGTEAVVPGGVVFVGFHGGPHPTERHRFVGNFVFSTDVPADAPSTDLNVLFASEKTTTKKARAANVNTTDDH